jgi:hypothetical protein
MTRLVYYNSPSCNNLCSKLTVNSKNRPHLQMARSTSLVFKMKRLGLTCSKILTKILQEAARLFREVALSLKVYDNILKIIEFVPSFLYIFN